MPAQPYCPHCIVPLVEDGRRGNKITLVCKKCGFEGDVNEKDAEMIKENTERFFERIGG